MRGCSGGEACVVARGACVVALGGACMVAPGGACMVALGGHAWLLGGVCMVAQGGHAWLLRGEACVVPPGGCVVLFGGHVWFYSGGMRGFFSFFGYNEIRSMSGRYASYWNAFLYKVKLLGSFDIHGIFIAAPMYEYKYLICLLVEKT